MIDTVADIKRKMEAERAYTAGWRVGRAGGGATDDPAAHHPMWNEGLHDALDAAFDGRDISWSARGYVEAAR